MSSGFPLLPYHRHLLLSPPQPVSWSARPAEPNSHRQLCPLPCGHLTHHMSGSLLQRPCPLIASSNQVPGTSSPSLIPKTPGGSCIPSSSPTICHTPFSLCPVKVKVTQSCPTLCDPILQAGILERVAMPSSRGSSQPRD